jgi:lipopolysaccharide export system protein LptA
VNALKFRISIALFLLLGCTWINIGFAQPISLQAGRMKSSRNNGKMVQLLKDNVRFEQSGSRVFCDEAEYDPESENLIGKGNVRILNPEGVVVTGRNLYYNNKTHIAKVEGYVVLKDGTLELATPWIQYNTQNQVGWYNSGGNITDKDTRLTSRSGSYDPAKKTMYFRYNVVLTTPDYTVKTDTLQYRTDSKVASFFSASQIDYKQSSITFQRGWYNTEKEIGTFYREVGLFEPGKLLVCDTLEFDKQNETGKCWGHVMIKDSANQLQGWGKSGWYNGKVKQMHLFGSQQQKALVYQTDNPQEPFKICADTLLYFNDSLADKAFDAIAHVGFLQDGFTGNTQRLTSWRTDSTVRFSSKPVLWDSATRISGDSMFMVVINKQIRRLHVFPKAFSTLEEGSGYFSQVSGDSMVNYFNQNQQIQTVRVYRKSKSVYFVRNDSNRIESANYIEGGDMRINMNDGKLETVTFFKNPEGTLFPIDQLPKDKRQLPGFIWDPENKPNPAQFIPFFEASIPALPYTVKPTKSKKKEVKR